MKDILRAGTKLVIASHNEGKRREIADLLAPFGIETLGARALQLEEPEETASDFAGNAALKARAACLATNLPALADDSGLCVDGLDGAPGIYSARWAITKTGRDFAFAMQRVQEELAKSKSDKNTAHFVCALALAYIDEGSDGDSIKTRHFEGVVYGALSFPPRGDKGFGYDPIFVPDGYDETFGEMEPTKKHALSHRALAFAKLVDACRV